ncbi:ABC transporter ATP-binding protein [Thiohalophilus sp.]|uniref:ABC transporter ATP-binding protein n=1 Tax=Thiohalophilus sp. TaxID=3028392 RepID=UPI002ACDC5F9|nr:ABC transporter ATP-binding protein [Thiohalophilus sp.]MDZ7662338.1 ABC transporter ATP-binding protein [Thiohalophilus sp.]MDZ7802421.1 ABC transporter ATP-binding protein [Thiohalophilus sp.]
MTSVLEFDSVSKSFSKGRKTVHALRDVSFSIPKGEVFGFVGPNGAGKSTTIKIMLDIINNYQGEVRIHGISARLAESRSGVSYLPESPSLYEQFTPLEILRMALRHYGIKRSDDKEWCGYWLERLSLTPYANRRIRQLSKGNVQRTAIAHAMVVKPRLLVLDEPLSGLDPIGRKDVIELLFEYKQQGGAIFFTSHVLHDVERIADRFGFINEGTLVTTRSPKELLSSYTARFIVRYQIDENITSGEQLRKGEYEEEIEQADMAAWLVALNQKGGQLIEARPATSLETTFFRILEEPIQKNNQKSQNDRHNS